MKQILKFIETNKSRYLEDLKSFLAIPSVSTDPENRRDVTRCAGWVADHMKLIGMSTIKVFPTAGHPIVYSEWLGAPGKPTVLLYGHYDVQPVDPIDLWSSPPFEATIRGNNLYARGAADDKGQVFIHFKGIEAHLQTRLLNRTTGEPC